MRKNGWKKYLLGIGITVTILVALSGWFLRATNFLSRFSLAEAATIRNGTKNEEQDQRLNDVEVDMASLQAGTKSANKKLDTILERLPES